MQKIKHNNFTSSYRPDVLVRGRGVGWDTKGYWYRQTGDDNNMVPISVRLRPHGWSKKYEYEITFGGRDQGIDLPQKTAHDLLTISVNKLGSKNNVVSRRRIYQSSYEPVDYHCPLCNNVVIWKKEIGHWFCSEDTCTFNYTPETCTDMHDNWSDSDFGKQHTGENHSVNGSGQGRNYLDRGALFKLKDKGTKELSYIHYNE